MTVAASALLRAYSLCDLVVGVECRNPLQDAGIQSLWPRLFAVREISLSVQERTAHLRFTETEPTQRSPSGSAAVYRSPGLDVFKTGDGFHLQCGRSMLDLDLSSSRGDGVLDPSFWRLPLQDQRDFFLLSLVMLLRSHGRYALHANGVARGDTGCLIVGGSGSGKTTLSIGLLRVGWSLLADDVVMLRRSGAGIEAQAFRRGLSCAQDMAAHVPGLSAAGRESECLNDGKWLLDNESLFPGRSLSRCCPRVLLFPELSGRPSSRLRPLDPPLALLGLVQQSGGIMTGQASVGSRHLELLRDLVEQSACYRLLLGRDAYRDPVAVSHLLWNA